MSGRALATSPPGLVQRQRGVRPACGDKAPRLPARPDLPHQLPQALQAHHPLELPCRLRQGPQARFRGLDPGNDAQAHTRGAFPLGEVVQTLATRDEGQHQCRCHLARALLEISLREQPPAMEGGGDEVVATQRHTKGEVVKRTQRHAVRRGVAHQLLLGRGEGLLVLRRQLASYGVECEVLSVLAHG